MIWKRAGLPVVLALLSAGGCALSARDFDPPVAAPQQLVPAGGAEMLERWWVSLQDDSLSAVIEAGLSGNFDLRTAWDRLAQARAIARRAGADLQPQLDAEAGATWTDERIDGADMERERYALGLGASYEVDLWGRIRSARDAAAIDAMAAAEDVAAAAITLSASIAAGWYDLAEAAARVRVLEAQIRTNDQVLDVIEVRFRQARSRAEDVLRQRNLVESSRGELILAQRDIQVALHQLAALTGLPPGAFASGEHPALIGVPPLPDAGLPAEILRRRPDVRSAYRAVQAADRRTAEAIADRYPRVSLSASADTTGEWRDLFDNWAATLAGNLVQPLMDGGRRKAEVERVLAVTSESINRYGEVVVAALREVADALERERRQAEYVVSLSKQLDTSSLVIERIRDSYINGQTDYLSVLDALTSRQSLEVRHVRARRDWIGFRIDFCRAIAGAWSLERPGPATFNVATTALSPDRVDEPAGATATVPGSHLDE
ncbi:MAG: hypothetical protein CMJ18_27270 [Phycisphaeraceae bacterium]|nr:hypothetical protein [Phycisphaeraceae bacterium]